MKRKDTKRKDDDNQEDNNNKAKKKQKVEDESEGDEDLGPVPLLQTIPVILHTGEKTNLTFYSTDDDVAKATDETILTAENRFFKGSTNIKFPEDYKYFLRTYNGGTAVSGDLKADRRDLVISYFLPLLDPKKGREENIEDSDDDEDDEDGGIAEYLELGEGSLPKNHLPIAIDIEGFVYLMDVDSTSAQYGSIYYYEETDDDEENQEQEEAQEKKQKGKKKKEEIEMKEIKVKGKTTFVADSFRQLLKNIMSDEEKAEKRRIRIERRLKQIESAPVQGAMRQWVDKWKSKFPHLEDHCRALVKRWEEAGVDQIDNAYVMPDIENMPMIRLITLAMFFIEKEKRMELNKQKKKQRKRENRKKEKSSSKTESESKSRTKSRTKNR